MQVPVNKVLTAVYDDDGVVVLKRMHAVGEIMQLRTWSGSYVDWKRWPHVASGWLRFGFWLLKTKIKNRSQTKREIDKDLDL